MFRRQQIDLSNHAGPTPTRLIAADLASVALDRLAAVPTVCVNRAADVAAGSLGVNLDRLHELDIVHCAVLVRTEFDPTGPIDNAPWLTIATARALIAAEVACVGIDGPRVDQPTTDFKETVTDLLAAAGIPIVVGLRGLDRVPRFGFCFTAVPALTLIEPHPTTRSLTQSTAVRAFATVPERPVFFEV